MVCTRRQRVEPRNRGFKGPASGVVAHQMRFVEYEQPELVNESLLVRTKARRELLWGHDDHISMGTMRVTEWSVFDDAAAQCPQSAFQAFPCFRGRGCGWVRRSTHRCQPLRGAG